MKHETRNGKVGSGTGNGICVALTEGISRPEADSRKWQIPDRLLDDGSIR